MHSPGRPAQARSDPAAAETGPRPGTTRHRPKRMRRPKSGQEASDMASFASSPSPTPLGTVINTKSKIRAIGRHDAPRPPNSAKLGPGREAPGSGAPAPGGVKPIK